MIDKIEIRPYNDYIICNTKAKKVKISWHGRWMARIRFVLARLRNPNCEVAMLTYNGMMYAVAVYKVTERIIYPDLEEEKNEVQRLDKRETV